MANYMHCISLQTQRKLNWELLGGTDRDRGQVLLFLENVIKRLKSGSLPASGLQILPNGVSGQRAGGVVTCSSTSGTLSTTINGTQVDATAGGSDTASATAIVAAINADATVSKYVVATNFGTTLTLASVAAATVVNILGVRLTAVSGTAGVDQFDISGNDTADAAALVTAINGHAYLSQLCWATSAAGVVYLFSRAGLATGAGPVYADKSTVTVAAATLAASANVCIQAKQSGELGNCCTLTVSGTGVTALAAKLVNGAGTSGATALLYKL